MLIDECYNPYLKSIVKVFDRESDFDTEFARVEKLSLEVFDAGPSPDGTWWIEYKVPVWKE